MYCTTATSWLDISSAHDDSFSEVLPPSQGMIRLDSSLVQSMRLLASCFLEGLNFFQLVMMSALFQPCLHKFCFVYFEIKLLFYLTIPGQKSKRSTPQRWHNHITRKNIVLRNWLHDYQQNQSSLFLIKYWAVTLQKHFLSLHVIYQTQGRVFHQISRHWEVGWKNEEQSSFF